MTRINCLSLALDAVQRFYKRTACKHILVCVFAATIVVAAGCSGANAVNDSPPVASVTDVAQMKTDAGEQTPVTAMPATPQSGSATSKIDQQKVEAANRVEVIYFHVSQRCVSCLCFEQNINQVIDKYYQDALASGKLTYRVLNVQKPENRDIVLKYRAVGSQLFVNTVLNGVDNIQDIQNIWNWKCETNARGFQLKVKGVIDQCLLKIP